MAGREEALWWRHFGSPRRLGAPASRTGWQAVRHGRLADGYCLTLWLKSSRDGWQCRVDVFGPPELIGAADWLAGEIESGRVDPASPPEGRVLAERLALPAAKVTVGLILEDALIAARLAGQVPGEKSAPAND